MKKIVSFRYIINWNGEPAYFLSASFVSLSGLRATL